MRGERGAAWARGAAARCPPTPVPILRLVYGEQWRRTPARPDRHTEHRFEACLLDEPRAPGTRDDPDGPSGSSGSSRAS